MTVGADSIRSDRPPAGAPAAGSPHPSIRRVLREPGVGFHLENAEQRVGFDDGIELRAFLRAESACGVASGEIVVTGLRFRVGLDPGERTGKFAREGAGERTHEAFESGRVAGQHAVSVTQEREFGEGFLQRLRVEPLGEMVGVKNQQFRGRRLGFPDIRDRGARLPRNPGRRETRQRCATDFSPALRGRVVRSFRPAFVPVRPRAFRGSATWGEDSRVRRRLPVGISQGEAARQHLEDSPR